MKRVMRYDAASEGFFRCSWTRYVQDAAASLQLTGQHRTHKARRAPTLRDGDQKFDESETAAFGSALGSVALWTQERLKKRNSC